MGDIKAIAHRKAAKSTQTVSTDKRWSVNDEMLGQVFGFTLSGYVVGVGPLLCFMDMTL